MSWQLCSPKRSFREENGALGDEGLGKTGETLGGRGRKREIQKRKWKGTGEYKRDGGTKGKTKRDWGECRFMGREKPGCQSSGINLTIKGSTDTHTSTHTQTLTYKTL